MNNEISQLCMEKCEKSRHGISKKNIYDSFVISFALFFQHECPPLPKQRFKFPYNAKHCTSLAIEHALKCIFLQHFGIALESNCDLRVKSDLEQSMWPHWHLNRWSATPKWNGMYCEASNSIYHEIYSNSCNTIGSFERAAMNY